MKGNYVRKQEFSKDYLATKELGSNPSKGTFANIGKVVERV